MPDRTASCQECGSTFRTNQPNKTYCGKPCRDRARHSRYHENHGSRLQVKVRDCLVCGRSFTAHRTSSQRRRGTGDQYRQTCSRECGQASINRKCLDCGERCGVKARCDRCRERRAPSCPVLVDIDCAWCGTLLVNWRNAGKKKAWRAARNRKYCSVQCEQWNHPHRPRVVDIDFRECRECGGSFTWYAGQDKDFCSRRCGARAVKRNRRHRERAAGIGLAGSITIRELAERDGWRCHLCGKKVPDREYGARPLDATIDHLIPLSAGGQHVPENVALAHFQCNWQRSNTGPAQLRLVA